MREASKNAAIGVLVAIAIALVLWVLVFLHPTFGDEGLKVHVRFTEIEKLNVGTRVTYAGRPVGEVKEIAFVPENERYNRQNPAVIYTYDLQLAIDSHIPIYTCDEITVSTSGLMGERYISIIPRRPKDQKLTLLTSDQIVYATQPISVEDAFVQVSSLAMKAEETIELLATLVKANRDEVETSLTSIKNASTELNTLLAATNKADLVTSLSKASNQLSTTMAAAEATFNKINSADIMAKVSSSLRHIDSITASLDQPETLKKVLSSANDLSVEMTELSQRLATSWPKISEAIDNVSSAADAAKTTLAAANGTVTTLQNVVTNMASGQGTMGKLLVSDDFYFKSVAIMNKMDLMMNDVNHYGVLYHLDKGWQRERRKRMAELAKLQNPREFKTYLDEELAKVTTSISRVGMALEKAENLATGQDPMQAEFGRTFNSLLAEVQELQTSLKNYNLEIAERYNAKPEAKEHVANEN